MGPPRAVLLKGPTLNSRVFLTAMPERHEDLVAKACELFKVPADHTPQLYVACQASIGPPNSEQRGALLMADAMPFLRDRELVTLRWVPSEAARPRDHARVQWDPKLDDRLFTTPVSRGPVARAAHVARVLERERSAGLPDRVPPAPAACSKMGPVAESPFQAPMSPPSSSPTASPVLEAPPSPTPQRAMPPLEWTAGDSDEDDVQAALIPAAPAPRKATGLGALCARLNPFAKTEHEPKRAAVPAPRAAAPQAPPTSPRGAAAYDVMTQVLLAVREHPRNTHFRAPHDHVLQRPSGAHALQECVARRLMDAARPLDEFAEALYAYLDASAPQGGALRDEALTLRRFAATLMGELSRTSGTKRPAPEDAAPLAKRTRSAAARAVPLR
ncbi:Hypothetical protein MSYG_2014 [Malassezia sympodialis ATCC 42132]|uniref:Uncharacterized protein n=1 Tax=Malassezia sympodialis (strain ATCC 42132) TaxID=1230383 RepID=A0A1M8A5C8_MALS4|nr:Hypothetical protein MSYG_2014 [Malassezia sympodialis ATCC 42132]